MLDTSAVPARSLYTMRSAAVTTVSYHSGTPVLRPPSGEYRWDIKPALRHV